MSPTARRSTVLAPRVATFVLVAAGLLLATLAPSARATERSEVPAKYKWDLTDLYPSDAAWTRRATT